jgi:Transglycosylase SLT domain
MTMQPACEVRALPLFDPQTNRSPFPAEIIPTIANGGSVKRAPSQRGSNAFGTRARAVACLRSLSKIVRLAAMLASSTLPSVGTAHAEPTLRVWRPPTNHTNDRFTAFIAEASRRFDVPTAWIRAVMHVESVGDVRARSPKGAMGLMQIMPETYAASRARYALGANPYDPHDNILAGAAYPHEMHDRYGAPGLLAAYNAGPRRYEEHLRTGRPLPLETQRYVAMLAPIVEGGQTDDRSFVVADVGAWLGSLLFPMQSSGKPAYDKSLLAAPPERQPTVRPTVDLSGLAPQSGNLFVRRIAEFQPQ